MQQPKLSRLPSNFTIEELLEAADSTPINIPTNTQSSNDIIDHDVFAFISDLKILPGDKSVDKRLIYRIYRNWSVEPLKNVGFALFMQQFFEYNQRSYLLNLDALEILKTPYKSVRKEKVDKTKSKNYKLHFESFLNFYKLTPGKFYVESSVLFYLYDKWTYENNNRSAMGSKQLIKFLSLYFDRKRIVDSKVAYFGVNEDIKQTHLNKECLETAERWARKANEKRTKKYREEGSSKEKRAKKTNNQEQDKISGSFDEGELEE